MTRAKNYWTISALKEQNLTKYVSSWNVSHLKKELSRVWQSFMWIQQYVVEYFGIVEPEELSYLRNFLNPVQM